MGNKQLTEIEPTTFLHDSHPPLLLHYSNYTKSETTRDYFVLSIPPPPQHLPIFFWFAKTVLPYSLWGKQFCHPATVFCRAVFHSQLSLLIISNYSRDTHTHTQGERQKERERKDKLWKKTSLTHENSFPRSLTIVRSLVSMQAPISMNWRRGGSWGRQGRGVHICVGSCVGDA